MNLKVDVVKELGAKGAEQEELIQEVKGLLSAAHDEDENVISTLNIDVNRRVRDAALSEMARRRHASALKDTMTITRQDLTRVGQKYRLKVRPTNEYAGTIPAELGAAVNRFIKEAGIPSMEHAKDRFFIMAPPEMFSVQNNEEINREFPTARPDPVLLYTMDRQNYDIVYKWGDDFTAWRRVLGLVNSVKFQAYATSFVFLSIGAAMLFLPTLFPIPCDHPEHVNGHTGSFEGIIRTFLGIGSIIMLAILKFTDFSSDISASHVSRYSEAVFIGRAKRFNPLYVFSVKDWMRQNYWEYIR